MWSKIDAAKSEILALSNDWIWKDEELKLAGIGNPDFLIKDILSDGVFRPFVPEGAIKRHNDKKPIFLYVKFDISGSGQLGLNSGWLRSQQPFIHPWIQPKKTPGHIKYWPRIDPFFSKNQNDPKHKIPNNQWEKLNRFHYSKFQNFDFLKVPYFCRIDSATKFYMSGSFFGLNHYKKPVFMSMRNYKEILPSEVA